jgi:hypothetical protein
MDEFFKYHISFGIEDRTVAFRPGEGIQAKAPVTYQMQWTGNADDLLKLANQLHMEMTSYPLDSYDHGDALGALIMFCQDEGEDEFELITDRGTLRMTTVPDLFKWEGLPGTNDDTDCKGA